MMRFTLLALGLSALMLSGCASLGTRLGLTPFVFSDDQPYLAQLQPARQTSEMAETQDSASDAQADATTALTPPSGSGSVRAGLATADPTANEPATLPKEMLEDLKLQQSSSLGLVDSPKLEQLLNDSLQHIKTSSGFTDVPSRVYLLASPGMGAYTSSAGNIYIPLPIVLDIQTQDEMDALLAHEFAHVVLKHSDIDIIKALQKKATVLYSVANRLGMDEGDLEPVSRRIRNSVALYETTAQILTPGWTRSQESDADRLAIDLLVVSERNLNSLSALLSRIEQWDKNNAALLKQAMPQRSLLVSAATQRFAQDQWQALAIQALEPLAQQVEEKVNQLSNTHDEIQARQDAIQAYVKAHYRRAPRPTPETRKWRQIAHSTQVRQLAKGVEQSMIAYQQLNGGNLNTARTALSKAGNRSSQSQTFYQIVQATLEEARGRNQQVLRITERAQDNAYPSFQTKVLAQRARNKLQSQVSPDDIKMLYAQFDQAGRPSSYYSDLITMADQTTDTGLRIDISARCLVENFDNADFCLSREKKTEKTQQAQNTSKPGVVGTFLGLFN